MAGKRLKKKSGWALLPGALLAAAMIMIPLSGSMMVDAAESAQPKPPVEPDVVVPWNVRLPSVSANDPTTPQKHYWERQVEESPAVDNSYFADAAFLGDSRTEGFYLYSGLKEGRYFYAVGATVESVFSKKTYSVGKGRKVPLLDALAGTEVNKVYVCLGANELGWVRKGTFKAQYGKLIDRVREDHPDVQILLQSILPVTASQEAKGSYVNNRRIREYNQQIQELSVEKDCLFVNVAEAFTGADGCLPEELSFDGIHLNTQGCRMWLDYLKTHTQ